MSDYNPKIKRRLALGALLGLSVAAPAVKASAETLEVCPAVMSQTTGLRMLWQQSNARQPLLGRQGHRAGRAPLYDRFMGHFWGEMDMQLQRAMPRTLDEKLAYVASAFTSAYRQYGRAIASHGVTPLLVVNSGMNNMWRFRELRITAEDATGQAWRAPDSEVMRLFSDFDPANERHGDMGRRLSIRFERHTGDFLDFTLADRLAQNVRANGATPLEGLRPRVHTHGQPFQWDMRDPSLYHLICRP